MQSIRGAGLLVKQAREVMLRNSTLLAALLKEEACNGCLNKAVLVPLRMVGDKNSHGAMQIFRQLVFHTHVNWHRIGCLVQLVPWLSTQPSGHGACSDVKKADSFRLSDALHQESRPALGSVLWNVSWGTKQNGVRSACQGAGSFSPEYPEPIGRPGLRSDGVVEKLWKADFVW